MSFGCELWVLSERDRENILAFERMDGRRIQRFPHRSLNQTSFYGLGWVRLTTLILVKKLLFVLTILKMNIQNPVRRLFVYRSKVFCENSNTGEINNFNSPVFDNLSAANRLGLLNTLMGMINGSFAVYGKSCWSKFVWSQAWRLEEHFYHKQ